MLGQCPLGHCSVIGPMGKEKKESTIVWLAARINLLWTSQLNKLMTWLVQTSRVGFDRRWKNAYVIGRRCNFTLGKNLVPYPLNKIALTLLECLDSGLSNLVTDRVIAAKGPLNSHLGWRIKDSYLATYVCTAPHTCPTLPTGSICKLILNLKLINTIKFYRNFDVDRDTITVTVWHQQ